MQSIFARYLDYLRAKNRSVYTIRNYESDLESFKGFLRQERISELGEVDRQIVRGYVASLSQKGVAKTSIRRKLSTVHSFYRYLTAEGRLATNPAKGISSPKLEQTLPDFLTAKEAASFVEAPTPATRAVRNGKSKSGQLAVALTRRDSALLELLYASGLRISELVGLDLGHVDLETREVRVVSGKGAKERIALMGEPAAQALAAYIGEGRPRLLGKKGTFALFLNRYGGRLTARTVQALLPKYASSTGMNKRVHPHLLRHTFATHLLDGGADLRVVQELLGHASLSSTQVYTHVSKAQAKKVYLSAHPLAREGMNNQ